MYKGALYVNVRYTLFSKCTRALTLENVCQVAPNLSALIGEIVGARLISHAGYYFLIIGIVMCVRVRVCVYMTQVITKKFYERNISMSFAFD